LKRTFFISAAALASLAVVGCNRGGDTAIATMNGEPITAEEYHQYLEMKPTVMVVAPDGNAGSLPVAGSLGFQAFNDLLRQKALKQIATDEGVWPTDEDIVKEMEFRKKYQPDFIRNLNSRGFSLEVIKRDLALQLAEERLITKGITITTEEAEKYIKDNPKQFEEPERIDVLMVVVNDQQKEAVDKDLGAGQMFQVVAQRHSIAPGARQNVRRSLTNLDALRARPESKSLMEILDKTPELRATEWIRDNNSWAKFYIERKVAAKSLTVDDTLKERVRRDLAKIRGTQGNDLQKRVVDRIKEAQVEVQSSYLKEPWKQAMEQLKASESNAAVPAQGMTGTQTESGVTSGN
jgi:hypothetical protein